MCTASRNIGLIVLGPSQSPQQCRSQHQQPHPGQNEVILLSFTKYLQFCFHYYVQVSHLLHKFLNNYALQSWLNTATGLCSPCYSTRDAIGIINLLAWIVTGSCINPKVICDHYLRRNDSGVGRSHVSIWADGSKIISLRGLFPFP